MEANQASAAVNQTVTQLQVGVLQFGIASAIPVISYWEQTLGALGVPELAPVSDNLTALRTALASGGSDPAEISGLLRTLAEQVRTVATTPYGLPIALPLTQLGTLLASGGAALEARAGRR